MPTRYAEKACPNGIEPSGMSMMTIDPVRSEKAVESVRVGVVSKKRYNFVKIIGHT